MVAVIALEKDVNKDDATHLVSDYVRTLAVDKTVTLTVLSDHTETYDFGWVFYYGSVDPHVLIDGNGPLLVDKNSGLLFETGTSHPLSYYLKNFEETGDPNSCFGTVLVLNSVTDDVRRIDAVIAIRDYAKISLGEAKMCFESCLDGQSPSVSLQTHEDAEALARRLTELGLIVTRNTEKR